MNTGRSAYRYGWLSIIILAVFAWTVPAVSNAAESGRPPDVRLDSVFEQPEVWRFVAGAEADVTIGVDGEQTHGTPQALRMVWNKDLGDLKESGIHNRPIGPLCAIELPDDLDVLTYTCLTFWAKMTGVRHSGFYVCVSDRPAMWGKDVKRTVTHAPLDAGDWSEYRIPLSHVDETERKAYRWFIIGCANMGRYPDEALAATTWVDDVVLSAEPLRKTRGWEADPTVVIVSQLGFRRFHRKLAVVDGRKKARRFVIRRENDGGIAFEGQLERTESGVGLYKVADFTPLTTPGRYVAEIGALSSLPFPIGDDVYRPCIEMLSDWVFNMRCGCETGVHPPCHTDDGILARYEGKGADRKELSRSHIDVVGGWHDAGDARTYFSYTFWMGHQCLRARDSGWRRDWNGDGVDDLMDSAAWAMRHLVKIRHPDTGVFLHKTDDWPDFRRGNYWTDGVVGTHDDRHVKALDKIDGEVNAVADACASAGLFARRAGPAQREIADAALAVARERWAVWFAPDTGRRRRPDNSIRATGHGRHVAKWGRGSLQLYLATSDPVYLDFARLCANTVMECQQRDFFRGGPQPMGGDICSWHQSMFDRDLPEEFLADLMTELPKDPDLLKWRTTLVRAANWWFKPARRYWRPFSVSDLAMPLLHWKDGYVGIPLEASPDSGATRRLVPTTDHQLGDTAHALQRVAQVLGDTELEQLARWQVQWTVGHNPFNVSWVCRFGSDSIDQHFSLAQGRMPGAVSVFGVGYSGVPTCVRPRGGEVWTKIGAKLMRAMIAVSEPARVRLTLRAGAEPWRTNVAVQWSGSGETVFEGTPDEAGTLPALALDGGQDYVLTTAGLRIPLTVISGTTVERTIDMRQVIALSAEKPKYVLPCQPFRIAVTVANHGLAAATTPVSVYAEDATTDVPMQTVETPAGGSTVIEWPFVAGRRNRPYVLIFTTGADPYSQLDVTGAILP